MSTLTIAIAQSNFTVGALTANTDNIIECAQAAIDQNADVVCFPELAITSYPPEDLLLVPHFIARVQAQLERLCSAQLPIAVVVGYPAFKSGKLMNRISVIDHGNITATYDKQCLPNYGVFDEARYFTPGTDSVVVDVKGVKIGLLICEDGWVGQPAQACKAAGAGLLIQCNASPFYMGKQALRFQHATARVSETHLPVVSVNLVGGQDELVFDGQSFIVNAAGEAQVVCAAFETDLALCEFDAGVLKPVQALPKPLTDDAAMYQALCLGVKDYVHKSGFSSVIIGLSGGIDSALTLAIASDALGPENVLAVGMPSRYTADMSVEDAMAQVKALGVGWKMLPIEPAFKAFNETLAESFENHEPDVTEENMQARCRAVLLMALSNKLGKLVLTTSNKSETAVGYSTLYGDMAGAFCVLKDVFKMQVYALAKYRNTLSPVIPKRVITRAPSAELREDQTDQDSLPDYEVLDDILQRTMCERQSVEETIAAGFDAAEVKRVVTLFERNEYKRRQSPLGPKLTPVAFGRDWRFPVVKALD
jgi:NAD+ synthase (glutamine-hydrolysing)